MGPASGEDTTGADVRVSFVIPVYHEPDNIGPTLDALEANVTIEHEVLIVYDTDDDPTLPVVRALQAGMPHVRLLKNELGRGVLNAMKAGLAAARAPSVIVSMADGSDDYTAIGPMVALAEEGADVVAASRYMRGGRQVGGPRLKGLLSRMAGLSLHYLGGVGTHDATNNFKLYRRHYLETVTIESEGGFELALELTVKATLDGRRVDEVPATWRDRTAGASNFQLRAWLPSYLRWYVALFVGQLRKRLGRAGASRDPA